MTRDFGIAIEVGSVIATKSLTAETKTENSSASMNFSAGRGNQFKVLFLGKDTPENPLDPEHTLYSLGWFGLHPEACRVIQKYYEKELRKEQKQMKDLNVSYSSRAAELERILKQLKQFMSYDRYVV